MAFENMQKRLLGWQNRLPPGEAYNLVNQAWQNIRDSRLWSFQLVEDSFATPNLINAGTFTVTQGSTLVTADATATTALTGVINPVLTQRQFRITSGGIYNIIGFSGSPIVLTLDRPFTDPTGTSQPYQVYQAYVPAPVADFKRWIDWRDLTNGYWLSIYMTRREVNFGDPQRLYFTFPEFVVPFATDLRQGSATFGNMLYELYPNPLTFVSYMRYWLRTGADLVNPGDTLPFPITEDMVFHRARMMGCQWLEGNRDPSIPRGQGADFKFLYKAAQVDYETDLKVVGKKDRDLVDLFLTRIQGRGSESVGRLPYYSTIAGRAYSGT